MDKKQMLTMGAGAGVGVLVPRITQQYVDNQYPEGIVGMKPSVFIPIITGGLSLGVVMFTNYIRNSYIRDFLTIYGFTALISGVVSYAMPSSLTASGRGLRLQAPAGTQYPYNLGRGNGYYMSTSNPYQVTSRVPSQQNITRKPGTGLGGVYPGVITS